MTTLPDDLLAAVLNMPDEDAPRTVAVDTNGEPERLPDFEKVRQELMDHIIQQFCIPERLLRGGDR